MHADVRTIRDDLQRIRVFLGRILKEHIGVGARRLPLLRQITVPSVAKWLILAFIVGLALGALLFPPDEPIPQPQIARAADSPSPTQPAEQPAAPAETRVKPQSPAELPGPRQETEEPRIEPPSNAVAPKMSAPPPTATVRPDVAVQPTAQPIATPPKVAARPTAVKLPRFRGSLAIDSDPPGALVFVDGQMAGSTPIVLKNVAAGSRVVRIQSNGYELWSGAARVVANQETRVTATLQR